MKVGSIVECVKDDFDMTRTLSTHPRLPKVGERFTIRGIRKSCLCPSGIGICFEEMESPVIPVKNIEQWFKASRFRELIPPIENIEEYINENTVEILEPIEL